MKWLLAVVALLLSGGSHATVAHNHGRIVQISSDDGGNMAIRLDAGFPGAVGTGECPGANVWAGTLTGAREFKALMLTAAATGQQVNVVTDGCTAGGAWFKIIQIILE